MACNKLSLSWPIGPRCCKPLKAEPGIHVPAVLLVPKDNVCLAGVDHRQDGEAQFC